MSSLNASATCIHLGKKENVLAVKGYDRDLHTSRRTHYLHGMHVESGLVSRPWISCSPDFAMMMMNFSEAISFLMRCSPVHSERASGNR